jgi:guanylate kinase
MLDIYKEIEEQEDLNILIILSGPTCAGKDSVMNALLERNDDICRVVTTTSREKRAGEEDGVDYHFVSEQEFEKLIAEEAFFEWVEYRGNFYGGQKKHIKESLDQGKDVIWRIDVRGVKNIYDKVKKEFPQSAFIFLAEEIEVLKARMERRDTESGAEKEWSMNRAIWELKQYKNFDFLVKNEESDLEGTVNTVASIIESEKRKLR